MNENQIVKSESIEVSNHDKQMAMIAHLSGFISIVDIIVPLIFLNNKDNSEFLKDHAREVLNFQISLYIYYFVAGLSTLILIGLIVLPVLILFHFVIIIIGAIKAYNGERFRYPLCIRFIK